jgi:hypothetical protein
MGHGIGYFPHMKRAAFFGVRCVFWAAQIFIHAIFPDLFTDTSVKIKQAIMELEKD